MTVEKAIECNKNLRYFMELEDRKNENKFTEDNYIALDMAIKALERQPSHKKGKWIGKGFGFACSECGYKYDIDDYTGIGVIHIKGKYCPNCGCNMEVEE